MLKAEEQGIVPVSDIENHRIAQLSPSLPTCKCNKSSLHPLQRETQKLYVLIICCRVARSPKFSQEEKNACRMPIVAYAP